MAFTTFPLASPSPARPYPFALSESRPLRFVTFFYLYVMQGLPAGFAITALANYMTGQRVSPAIVGTFVATVGLPWAFQFVWGPLIDRFQTSPMGRRRPWVVGAQLLAFVASLGISLVPNPLQNVAWLGWAFFAHSVCASIQDASVDAMAISVIPEHERGRINAFMRGGFLSGMAVGAAGGAWLLHTFGLQTAALCISAALLMFTVVTFFIKEHPADALWPGQTGSSRYAAKHEHTILWLFRELFRGLMARQSLLYFIPIVLSYSAQSAFIRSYNTHLIRSLGWSDQDVSVMSGTVGTLLVLGVVLVGGWLADRFGAQRLIRYVFIYHFVYLALMSALHSFWPDRQFATVGLVLWNTMDPTLSVAAMPLLMALCRPSVEGSQFTAYMALVNACDILGAFISGYAQQWAVPAPVIGDVATGMVAVAGAVVWYTSKKI